MHAACFDYTPNDSFAFVNLALYYNEYYGQFEKAIPKVNEALRVEPADRPLAWNSWNLGKS